MGAGAGGVRGAGGVGGPEHWHTVTLLPYPLENCFEICEGSMVTGEQVRGPAGKSRKLELVPLPSFRV